MDKKEVELTLMEYLNGELGFKKKYDEKLEEQFNIIDLYMENLKSENRIHYQILVMFFRQHQPWKLISENVYMSEKGCQIVKDRCVTELMRLFNWETTIAGTFEDAEQTLIDYYRGYLKLFSEHSKEIDVQFEVVDLFIKYVEEVDETNHRILTMYYKENQTWNQIEFELLMSAKACQARRNKLIEELERRLVAVKEVIQ